MKTASLALLAALTLSLAARADLRYTVVTKVEGAPKGAPANQVMQMTAADDKARIDFKEGSVGKSGDFLLTKDGGRTMTLVSAKDKTYMNWDMNAMMGMMNAMGGMMKMEVTDPKVEKLLDEPGQPILGYPTRHYKTRISYGMSMTVMGFNTSTKVDREEEAWTTTRIDSSALSNWVKQVPKINESLDKLIAMEREKMKGIPLKMISVDTTTDKNGKVQTTKRIMEVTEISETKADPAAFEIPAGYKELKMGGDETDKGAGDAQPAMPQLPPFLRGLRK